ncbi:MAG: hypothetical protein WCS37_02845 [Chloroflexota bacterium]|nr:hypothetical protein [Chloroflexota bacterium]
MVLLNVLLFMLGVAIVAGTLLSAIQTFVLPRSARDPLTSLVFRVMRVPFDLITNRLRTYRGRDRVMALYVPISLLTLPVVWLTNVALGYMLMYLTLGVQSWQAAFTLSGSSLLTLGFAPVTDLTTTLLAFSEAIIGLILVALLIAYLPTMYSAFSRRETAVTLLEVRAGSPPSAAEMILRFHRMKHLSQLNDIWVAWEVWFVEVEETHTSLAALSFFRSPQPNRSWITAAGAVLDTAALVSSTIDQPRQTEAELCIRAGFLALRHIATFFRIPYDPNPKPNDPISVTHQEFEEVYDQLVGAGVPVKPDREQAWRDFAGWRVNYDTVLLALAALTMAPEAPWSSDRSLRTQRSKRKLRRR